MFRNINEEYIAEKALAVLSQKGAATVYAAEF
jgi:hypothetical protein